MGDRSQIGIGTLVVFIAMVLVAMIAGGVLLETTGYLQGESTAAGEQSSQQVTDRVVVRYATATYSGGSMDSLEIDLAKAPGAGDIDLADMSIHWLDSSGSTEITSTTFSVSAKRGTASVLEADSDVLTITDLGQTIADGEQATVRLIPADGGPTTVVLQAPRAPPADGAVSLLRASPGGNPGGAGGGLNLQWASATVDWHQDSCCLGSDYEPHDVVVGDSDRGHFAYETFLRTEETDGTNVYDSNDIETDGHDIDLYNDVLYAATSGGIEAFAESTGNEQWTTSPSSLGMNSVDALSISSGGTIYASGDDLAALDTDGNVKWTMTISGDSLVDVEHYDGSLYAVDSGGSTLYKVDPSDQSVTWTKSLAGSPDAIAAADNRLFVTWSDTLSGMQASDGAYLWNETSGDNSARDVEIGPNNFVYYSSAMSDGKVRKVYPNNGTRIWTVDPTDDDIDHIGVGSNGSVYASATGSMTIYRIEQSA